MTEPALSIVVIGRNEGHRLSRCLESLKVLTGFPGTTEILYVDSGSVDGSPANARSHGAEVIVLDDQHPTAARGRNAGWRRARAPYILFLDGDTILNPAFPQVALRAIAQRPEIAAVWGHRRELYPEHSIFNRVLDLDWIYPSGETEYCGGDVLMRKSALAAVEGFDPTMIAGEEPELCRRLRGRGYRILHLDSPMTGHDLDMTRFGQYWKRAIRAGHAYAEASFRFRDSSDPMWVRESRKNLVRGAFWVGSFAAAVSALALSWFPLAIWFAMLFVVATRSARKASWKAPGRPFLLFLYGIHSHLQQVPILYGQLQHNHDQREGRHRQLIEYKETTSL